MPLDPFHMGITAENVAEPYGITREDQDLCCAISKRAVASKLVKEEIVPIEIPQRKEGDPKWLIQMNFKKRCFS